MLERTTVSSDHLQQAGTALKKNAFLTTPMIKNNTNTTLQLLIGSNLNVKRRQFQNKQAKVYNIVCSTPDHKTDCEVAMSRCSGIS